MWYTWPFNLKGVLYWTNYMENARQVIYLFGNPFVWWGTTLVLSLFAAFVFYFLFVSNQTTLPAGQLHFICYGAYLVSGYVINWIPYIGITRVCFIYHYMPSLFFVILLAGLFFDYFVKNWRAKVVGASLIVLLAAWHFWYFSPLTYGTEMTTAQAEARQWVEGWGA